MPAENRAYIKATIERWVKNGDVRLVVEDVSDWDTFGTSTKLVAKIMVGEDTITEDSCSADTSCSRSHNDDD